jgi:hypothetical protein
MLDEGLEIVPVLPSPELDSITIITGTYRSGTQWLTAAMGDTYYDVATVRHEPVGSMYFYIPEHGSRAISFKDLPPTLQTHLVEVSHMQGDYIEIAWQSCAAITIMRDYFPGKVKVVHLTRDPHDTARSAEKCGLDLYRMGLRRWLSTHARILRVQGRPWMRMKIEDLWSGRYGLRELTDFVGLEWRDELEKWTGINTDNHFNKPMPEVNKEELLDMDDVLRMARRLGYDY